MRFIDNKFIFKTVYSVVSSVLDGTARAADFVLNETRLPEIKSETDGNGNENKIYCQQAESSEDLAKILQKYDKSSSVEDDIKAAGIEIAATSHIEQSKLNQEPQNVSYFDPLKDISLSELIPKQQSNTMCVTDDTMPPSLNGNIAAYEVESRLFNKKKEEQQKIDYVSCKYKGNLFNTYLIYEVTDTVYIIDQHAAHERLIYDRLREKLAKRDIARQALLVPYIFTANPAEARFLEEKQPLLRTMGFGIAPFGFESFRIDEVPVDLQDINIKEFFDDILAEVDGLKEIKIEDVLKDKIAMTACKHAIKGGMQLTEGEIDALFKLLDGNMGLKCPHGRPVCVTLKKKDIEKMFKRIV